MGGVTALTRPAATPPLPATATTLTSVGSDAAPATATSARSAIAENGRYAAFQSDATLKVSASVVPPGRTPPQPGTARVYVRDEIGQKTTLLSDPNAGNATAPSISASGRLVSYQLNGGAGDEVVAVDRKATGAGTFDAPGNLTVRPVTGSANDLRYERIPACPAGLGDGGALRTTPCGPKLSADGTTLVYPAQLSPVSPALTLSMFGDPLPGDELNFGSFPCDCSSPVTETVTYTVNGNRAVTFSQPTATGQFSVITTPPSGAAACAAGVSVLPGGSCSIEVSFDWGNVCVPGAPGLFTGDLITNATDPAGQSALALVAYCNSSLQGTAFSPPPRTTHGTVPQKTAPQETMLLARRVSSAAGPAACPAPPKGPLRLAAAPAQEQDNNLDPLIDLGDAESGAPYVAWAPFTIASSGDSVLFQSQDCGIQLVDPANLQLADPTPPGQPGPCSQGEVLNNDGPACTAYFLVNPASAGTDVAALGSTFTSSGGTLTDGVSTGLTARGVSHVVIARRDATGAGKFGASPSTVVSVDSKGTTIPNAREPSVSASGRYVAFTAPVPIGTQGQQVDGSTDAWRHDTDVLGNKTFKPGGTILVSCLPGTGPCARAPSADSPSLSGDGNRVAFASDPVAAQGTPGPVSPAQVYARDIAAGSTVFASVATTGGGADDISYAPALSQDGTTVAYISKATDLTAAAVPRGAANLFVRTLVPGPAGNTELATPTGTSLARGDDIALPAIDAHGRLVTFQTSAQQLPQAPPETDSVYTFERFPHLVFAPAQVAFGSLTRGNDMHTRTLTVTDTGPGPGTVSKTASTLPFGFLSDSCAGIVLYAGTRCQLTVLLIPRLAGHDQGTATVSTTDDGEPTVSSAAPLTATVLAPPPSSPTSARLAATPDVAPGGQVTQVRGSGFLGGQHVTLSWNRGLGPPQAVTADGSGQFTTALVIFPDDLTGSRILQAKDASGQLLASTPFLVERTPVEPPFTQRPAP